LDAARRIEDRPIVSEFKTPAKQNNGFVARIFCPETGPRFINWKTTSSPAACW